MWDPAEFAEHWRREFPGSEVPRMQLNSVAELEAELERSRERLRLGQNLLAREKFKVIYLETALGREPPGTTTRPESPSQRRRHEGIGAPGGSQQTYSSGKHWSSPGPEGDFLGSHSNGADQGAENAGQNQDHQWRDGDSEEDVETEPSPSPARPLLFPRFRGLPMKRGKDASPMLQRQQFLTVSPTIHGDSCPSEGSDREQGSDRDSTDFSFAEGCGGESSEEACAADQEGPETLPYIDESPTTSPQISVNSQEPGLLLPLTPEALTTMGGMVPETGLEMRDFVLSGVLVSEQIYLNQLEAALVPLKPLKAAATTSQPVLSSQQIDTIFYKLPQIHHMHRTFCDRLTACIQDQHHPTHVGHLFQQLADGLGLYKEYVDNYELAVEMVEKCSQANNSFKAISEDLKVKNDKDSKETSTSVTLETLLYKPIDRVTRSTLVLHDLLKHTPASHPDYPLLQDALRTSHNFLSSINAEITEKTINNRQMVKDGFMVEVSDGTRKLRHVFLFSDLLLCAKLKKPAVGKLQQYDCKWYIPLSDLVLLSVEECEPGGQIPTVTDRELDEVKMKISQAKNEIQREKKVPKAQGRALERLKKKMFEQESWLLLHSPNIPFRIHSKCSKSFQFLLSSDYERCEWREAIERLQSKDLQCFVLSSVELQMLIRSCVKLRTIHNIPVTSNKEDDDPPGLYGFLHVIIRSASGFKNSASLYCTLEVDSFGYFVSKAKTRVFRDTTEPQWNEEFEIDVEGSQWLRVLCYEKSLHRIKPGTDGNEIVDKIVGKGQVQLDAQLIQGRNWQPAVLNMNGVEVHLSMKFTSRDLSLKRTPSRTQSGVFGVKIGIVTKRERSKVPYVVRQCVEEVENRGFGEVGIYRVSGAATHIQALRAAFDTNAKDVLETLRDLDINAIAGTLKLYFRQLPEPLLTDKLYPAFVEGIALSDPAARENCMLHLLRSLPEPNTSTFLFLLDHLRRVAEKEPVNKMSIHNLATVFGPTLLRPSGWEHKAPAHNMTEIWSLDVMAQVQVLLYYLQHPISASDLQRNPLFSSNV